MLLAYFVVIVLPRAREGGEGSVVLTDSGMMALIIIISNYEWRMHVL